MKNKIFIQFALLLLVSTGLYAQQDAQFSQYMFNHALLNPAAAGADGINATLLYRTQWVSQPGAPKSIGLIADAPIVNNRVGLGINLLHTTLGSLSFSRANANFSYKINLTISSAIHLGLQAGMVQYSIDNSNLILPEGPVSSDPTFAGSNLRKMIPDFGFGIYYKSEKAYIGLTIPHLLQSRIKFINQVVDTTGLGLSERKLFSQIFRHYYFTAGLKMNVSEDFQIQPQIMSRYVVNAPFVADLNCNVIYKQMFWAGLGYRLSNMGGMIAMAGIELNKTFRLGYAFDLSMGDVAAFTGSSHEIMLTYHLDKEPVKGKVRKSKKGGTNKPYFLR
jgi:type IX secretion system PorP/SprF family membrane protein